MIQMLSVQVASLAEVMQSLQTRAMAPNPPPQVVHTIAKNPLPNVDPQAQTEIKRLKQTIKTLAKLKHSLTIDPFDDLPRITLSSNFPLDFKKYNGTTDTLYHIKTFKMKTRSYVEDPQVLTYLFQ